MTQDAFDAKAVDGVSPAQAWTQANQGDPGETQLELFSWIAESLAYRVGIVGGLSIVPADDGAGVTVAPGQAVAPDGRPIEAHEERRRVTDSDQ